MPILDRPAPVINTVKDVLDDRMELNDLFIRFEGNPLPRIGSNDIAPRTSAKLQTSIEPVYREAIERYKDHFDDAMDHCASSVDISGEPFPEGDPDLRVTDQILGSENILGAALVEPDVGTVNTVVNISEALTDDVEFTIYHELAHTSWSQRGMDWGPQEEAMADCVAEYMLENTGRIETEVPSIPA